MQPRISMITLGVDNLQKAIACYEQGLRFPQMESSPGSSILYLKQYMAQSLWAKGPG